MMTYVMYILKKLLKSKKIKKYDKIMETFKRKDFYKQNFEKCKNYGS